METAVGLGIGFGGGVVLTILGAILTVRLQRQRCELGYEILSANVIIPKLTEPNPAAAVVVRRSALEGRPWGPDEPDEPVPVEEVYGFRVRLRNCGNVVLHDQAVRVTFDQSTKVILANMESAPELGDERIDIAVTDEGRSVVATFPYLNPRATAIVSVQTVYNSTRFCRVVAAAPGLGSFDMARRRTVAAFAVPTGLTTLLLGSGGAALGLGVAGVASERVNEGLQTAAAWLLIAGIVVLIFDAMMALGFKTSKA